MHGSSFRASKAQSTSSAISSVKMTVSLSLLVLLEVLPLCTWLLVPNSTCHMPIYKPWWRPWRPDTCILLSTISILVSASICYTVTYKPWWRPRRLELWTFLSTSLIRMSMSISYLMIYKPWWRPRQLELWTWLSIPLILMSSSICHMIFLRKTHASTKAECRLLTAAFFYHASSTLGEELRLVCALVGFLWPLFPPREPGHVEDLDWQIPSVQPWSAVPERRLRNGGNWCYMNSTFQLLATDPVFVDKLQEHSCGRRDCLGCIFRRDSSRGISVADMTPAPLVLRSHCELLERPGFALWSLGGQQDCNEFLMALRAVFDSQHELMPSVVHAFYDRFGVVRQQKMMCRACGFEGDWSNDGDYAAVTLEVKSWEAGDTMQNAVDRELGQEPLDRICSRCQKADQFYRTWRVGRLPPCLFVNINRTSFHQGTLLEAKRQGSILSPTDLHIDCSDETVSYTLVAAACHSGRSIRSGHWTTWRPGFTVNSPESWVIDDDDRRRPPSLSSADDLERDISLALFVRSDTFSPNPPLPTSSANSNDGPEVAESSSSLPIGGVQPEAALNQEVDEVDPIDAFMAEYAALSLYEMYPEAGEVDPVDALMWRSVPR